MRSSQAFNHSRKTASRREFLRRSLLWTGVGTAGLVGGKALADQVDNIGVGIPRNHSAPDPSRSTSSWSQVESTTTLPEKDLFPREGFHLWADQPASPAVVEGVHRLAPGFVRWKVQWDYLQRTSDTPDWTVYRPFFEMCAALGIQLYLAITVRNSIPAWARVSPRSNIPRRGTMDAFTSSIQKELQNAGVDVVWQPCDEPDHRLAMQDIDGQIVPLKVVENYHNPWEMTPVNWRHGEARWTGGSGEYYQDLFAVPERVYASSGLRFPRWIEKTAPHIDQIDLHLGEIRDLDEALTRVVDLLRSWDRVRPGLPFLIGEATVSEKTGVLPKMIQHHAPNSAKASALLRKLHDRLIALYPERYLGLVRLSRERPWEDTTGWWKDA